MADTASLVARVKTDGAEQAAKQLDGFARSAEKADKASDNLGQSAQKAQPKLKGFGTGAQQVGYQMQDLILQIQGGTSAFVALGQQGSQLAGAFGPGGAVIGAIIALSAAAGGTLYKAFSDAAVSAEDLQTANENLKDVLTLTEKGVYDVSDAFVTYIRSGASVAEINAAIGDGLDGLDVKFKDITNKVLEAGKAINNYSLGASLAASTMAQAGNAVGAANLQIASSAEKLGLSVDQWKKLRDAEEAYRKEPTVERLKAYAAATDEANTATKGQNEEVRKLNSTVQRQTYNAEQNIKAQEKLKNALEAGQDVIKKQDQAEQDIADRKAQRIKDQEARQAAAAQRTADRQAKAIATEQAQQKLAADNFIAGIQRQNSDELKAIDAQEQQKMAKLAEYRQQNAITDEQYEQTKTQIAADAETARQEEIAKRKKEADANQQKGQDFLTQIAAQNASELELYDIQEQQKLAVADKYRQQGLISEEDYAKAMQDIQGQYNKKREDSYMDSLGTTTDNLKTALGEGNALYKAAAITETVINTYKAATAAYSALAPIPIVGPGLGVAAAAAATAAGLANVSKIRSAREQGGQMNANQPYLVGERGPEIIMPSNASKASSAAQTRALMNGNGGNANSVPNISIVNNTSGRVDNVQTEMDEDRLRIIINEQVSNQLQDSNSSISKARRSTRGLPGH